MVRRKKKPITPKSQIRSALRQLWLRSRERSEAIRLGNGQCFNCGSDFKLEVHHINPIDWDYLFDIIRAEILTDKLLCVCQTCHAIITEGERDRGLLISLRKEGINVNDSLKEGEYVMLNDEQIEAIQWLWRNSPKKCGIPYEDECNEHDTCVKRRMVKRAFPNLTEGE